MFEIEAWHWLVLALVLIGLEAFTFTFALLMFGLSALLVAAVTAVVPMGNTAEVLIWLFVSVASCALWFGFINPKFKNRTKAGLGGDAYIGETGLIVRVPSDSALGRVRFSTPVLGADEWSCRVTSEVSLGQRVQIKAFVGNDLLVEPAEA